MTSHSLSPVLRAFLTLALLSIFVMITLGMSRTLHAAIPALCLWTFLAASYGAYRVVHTWKPARRAI